MNKLAIYQKKSGMSLGEVLIAVAIIGVLAAVVMPVIKQSLPDKYETLHKKGDFALEHGIAEIVNDEYLYNHLAEGAEDKSLLENTDAVTVNGIRYSEETKLCGLFASKFNLYPGTAVNCSATPKFENDGGTPTFTSNDGIQWLIPASNFSSGSIPIAFRSSKPDDIRATHCAVVNTDVIPSGVLSSLGLSSSKSENGSFYTTDYNGDCPKPDTYVYVLSASGKLITSNSTSDNLKPQTMANVASIAGGNETTGTLQTPDLKPPIDTTTGADQTNANNNTPTETTGSNAAKEQPGGFWDDDFDNDKNFWDD